MTDDLKPIIAARVRAARRAKSITQAELAEQVSRTVEAISNLERGLSLPPLDLLQNIARVLEVGTAELIEAPGAGGPVSERARLEQEARGICRDLPTPLLKAAVRQLAALGELDQESCMA